MLERCCACNSEFLTEADPYIVRPTKDGIKLYCSCYIVGYNQFDYVDKIKELESIILEKDKVIMEQEKERQSTERFWKGKLGSYDELTDKIKELSSPIAGIYVPENTSRVKKVNDV